MKTSFLKQHIADKHISESTIKIANKIFIIGFISLIFLIIVSRYVKWMFLSNVIDIVTGTSVLFVFFILCMIVTLDIPINIDESKYNHNNIEKSPKYIFTIFWCLILVCLGIVAIYGSNKYRKHYKFECTTFLVDQTKGIYHLNGYNNNCALKDNKNNLIKMNGYEIENNTNCVLCPDCAEWISDVDGFDMYYRK